MKFLLLALTLTASSITFGQTVVSTSSNGAMTVSGPNGFMMSDGKGNMISVSQSTEDDITGSWTKGLNVGFGRVLQGLSLPPVLVLQNFDVKIDSASDNTLNVIAATPDETKDKTSKEAAIIRRANIICQMTQTYPHVQHIETSSKWFGGSLLDVTQTEKRGEFEMFKVYKVSALSGARYFTEIRCGQRPFGAK